MVEQIENWRPSTRGAGRSPTGRIRKGSLAGVLAVMLAVGLAVTTAGTAGALPPPVYHWGAFISGGVLDQDTLLSPTSIPVPGSVVQVSSSNAANYALLSDGTVYAWGIGTAGELGNGGTSNQFTTPVRVAFPAGVSIAKLADTSPYDTALAIDTAGNAWGWGLDGDGQLCLGNTHRYLTPVQIPLAHVTALAGAGDHALYVVGGNVSACGNNANGDLGNGSTTPSTVPTGVTGLQTGSVASVYTSWRNSGALLTSGQYDSWGYNGLGNVGNGHAGTDALTPQAISLTSPVTHAALGGSGANNGQTLVMLSNGTLRSWGFDKFGQLGDHSTKTEASPITFAPPTNVTYVALATGGSTSYAIDTGGNVWAWGNNNGGQVGNGTVVNQKTPVTVLTGVSQISATAKDVVAH
jgi:alpha-tubulin suppressor-like RCC1 family protein